MLFFLTLFLLGQSSSFALTDAFITMIYDADWAKKYPRIMYVLSQYLTPTSLHAKHLAGGLRSSAPHSSWCL